MSDIFREVEEEVRREQAKKLWDRYGTYVIGVAVLIVAVTAGYRGWEWYSARQAAQAGAEYYAAMQLSREGKAEEAEAAFNEIAAGNGGVATLARLRAAAVAAESGEKEAAVAEYDAVAGRSGVQRDLRNVARVRAAYILLEMGDRAGVEQRVGDMAVEGNIWRASARELLGLAAYQAGDIEAATQRFDELLADNETPNDMRGRAQLMVSLLAADRAPGPEASAEDAATDNQ
jgi:hypothetical protein